MARWKTIVDEVAADPDAAVTALFFGEANLIAGYRLYYMLRYASRAGLRDLTLLTDGRFWIDEASTWLLECGVSRVAILGGAAVAGLDARVAAMQAAAVTLGLPAPEVVTVAAGPMRGDRTIDCRGEEVR